MDMTTPTTADIALDGSRIHTSIHTSTGGTAGLAGFAGTAAAG